MASGKTLKKRNACLHAVRQAVEKKIACIYGLRSEGVKSNLFQFIHFHENFKNYLFETCICTIDWLVWLGLVCFVLFGEDSIPVIIDSRLPRSSSHAV